MNALTVMIVGAFTLLALVCTLAAIYQTMDRMAQRAGKIVIPVGIAIGAGIGACIAKFLGYL